tara:strand:+ start:1692 stop:2513 length:822 start_codon:yes stop_codon:yes gene_type:complete
MADSITLGSIVKNVAGGFINKTKQRLLGSGISTDSRLVNVRAKWSGRHDTKDWRVRLQIPAGSALEMTFFDNNPLLESLYSDKGFFFPLTPSMIIQHSASYNPLAQTHSNYPFQAYQNSQVDQMNIIGEFPVQNSEDAKYWVATVNFLRTVTKMFFGKEQDFKGNPPPILHLSGYGDHMFDKVPVIVQSFNVELRAGVDYISTQQMHGTVKTWKGLSPDEQNIQINTPSTWAPTLSTVSAGVIPVYSRESLKQFSLKEFASGTLSKETGIGFI